MSGVQRLKSWAVPGMLLLLVGYMQWPMLKGRYYQSVPPAQAKAAEMPWQTNLETAMAESVKSGKPILLDFSASWCPPCQVMKHEVWTDPKVQAAVSGNFVPVLLDIDLPENKAAAQRYKVESIPAVFVIDGKGQPLKQGGYMAAEDTVEFLKDFSQ